MKSNQKNSHLQCSILLYNKKKIRETRNEMKMLQIITYEACKTEIHSTTVAV
jgi:hypothetical protein